MSVDPTLSAFGLTGRDAFPRPTPGTGAAGSGSSVDAALVNLAAAAATRLETWAEIAVPVDGAFSRNAALGATVQRWLWDYTTLLDGDTGDIARARLILPLSAAVLEDCLAIPGQSVAPADPARSLAAAVGSTSPAYTALAVALPDEQGAARTPQPAWTRALAGADTSVSVRLLGATDTQTLTASHPVFFDAGTGVLPRLAVTVAYSSPDRIGASLPLGTYEVCLLVLNWIP